MNPPALPLRPLGTGELLDRALTVYRTQFRELFKLSLAFALVQHLAAKGFELLAFAKFPQFVQLRSFVEVPDLRSSLHATAWAMGSMVIYMGLSIALWQMSIGAVSTPAELAPSSVPLGAGACWARLRPRLGALSFTLLLELAVILANVLLGAAPFALAVLNAVRNPGPVGLALLALGAGLSLLLMTGLFLVALLRYLLVPSVVVVEGRVGWSALARASGLMRGRAADTFWLNPKVRGSLVMLVLGLASNAVLLVATAPRSLLLAAGTAISPNAPLMLFIEALEVLASAGIAPFGMVTLALFYLDLRVRREGLDLALTAERLEKAA